MTRPLFIAFSLALTSIPSFSLTGDLNGDGVVNYEDFFLFADQFGQESDPQPSRGKANAHSDPDGGWYSFFSKHNFRPNEDRSNLPTREFCGDLLNLRPPLFDTWTEPINMVESSTYWLGVADKSRQEEVIFIGTGFALNTYSIVTNYHVAREVARIIREAPSYKALVFIAVRANSRIYGGATYYLGTIDDNRELLGFWHPSYDGTPQSPDLAMFLTYDPTTGEGVQVEDYALLTQLDHAMVLEPGEEIGILGFPGILETNHSPRTLNPIPTFKMGTISALRPFSQDVTLSTTWQRSLLGHYVQHDLDTMPGNSGSPIFNKRGEVIAMHNSGIQDGDALDFGIRADQIRLFNKSFYVDDSYYHVNAKPVAGSQPPYLIPPFPHSD